MTQPRIALDHIIVAADTLDIGVDWVQARTGLTVPHGGAHDHMATHNCVGRIGHDIYLEIIAINPDATPDRVRWFSLGDPAVQQRLKREGAFLHHWAVNSSDIEATLAGARHEPGPAMAMSRGDLHWRIAVRDDGILPRDGLLPTIIQWPDIPHPSRNMTHLGYTLKSITLHCENPSATEEDLAAMGAGELCQIAQARNNALSVTLTRDGIDVEL